MNSGQHTFASPEHLSHSSDGLHPVASQLGTGPGSAQSLVHVALAIAAMIYSDVEWVVPWLRPHGAAVGHLGDSPSFFFGIPCFPIDGFLMSSSEVFHVMPATQTMSVMGHFLLFSRTSRPQGDQGRGRVLFMYSYHYCYYARFEKDMARKAEVATAVVGVLCLDTTIAVEGIAFDIWGESEEDAVKASSVSLSSFTVLCASAATFAGLIYDAYSWFGLTVYHVVFISIEVRKPPSGVWQHVWPRGFRQNEEIERQVVLLFTEPACWQSLRDWWRPKEEQEEVVTAMDQVVPAPKPGKEVGLDLPTLPGAVEDEPAQKKVPTLGHVLRGPSVVRGRSPLPPARSARSRPWRPSAAPCRRTSAG